MEEFDSWGIVSLNETLPLAKNGLFLSIDEDEPYNFKSTH
jgi:hypothetical protein